MTGNSEMLSAIADAMFAAFDPWNSNAQVVIDLAYMEGRFEKMAQAALEVIRKEGGEQVST